MALFQGRSRGSRELVAPTIPPRPCRRAGPVSPVSPRIYRSYSVRTVNIPRGGERDGATRAGRHAGDMSISSHQFSPYFCPHSCGQKYGQSLFCGVPLFSGGVFSGRVFSGGLFFFSSTVYGQRAGEFRRSFCHASREPLPSTLPSIVTSTVTSILDGR